MQLCYFPTGLKIMYFFCTSFWWLLGLERTQRNSAQATGVLVLLIKFGYVYCNPMKCIQDRLLLQVQGNHLTRTLASFS